VTYKYFPEVDQGRMDEEFMEKLIELRVRMVCPMRVTSHYRGPDHPLEKKKTRPGAHALGRAVDIAINGEDAYRLIKNAPNFGMTGIGVSQKGAHSKRFIHLDDLPGTPKRPRPRIWSY